MKKNAIVIAGIMFVAGCATNGGGYHSSTTRSGYTAPTSDVAMSRSTELVARTPQGELIPPSDPSLASQYDPARGGFGTSVSGSASSAQRNPQMSVNDYHADSSIPGGSNEARGYSGRNLPTEGPAHPMDPSVQADSSIRGGSPMARQRERSSYYEPAPANPDGSRIRADSSVRGGSNEARFPNRNFRSSNDVSTDDALDGGDGTMVIVVTPDNSAEAGDDAQQLQTDRDDFGQSRSDLSLSDKANGSVRGSANWNPSDDLLPDGTERGLQQDNDASVGGAAVSESGSSSSTSDMEKDQATAASNARLNSSANLEKDISGQYSLDQKSAQNGSDSRLSVRSSDSISDSAIPSDKGSENAVGDPGSTETGVASSSSAVNSPDRPGSSSEDAVRLFRDNRAQGVGSAATGEFGTSGTATSDLAQRVKKTLTRESTGTFGMTRSEVAKGVEVTDQGGTITLKGTVPSQKDKDMIEVRAREISGVHQVKNELKVATRQDSSVRDLKLGRDLEDANDQLKDVDHHQE